VVKGPRDQSLSLQRFNSRATCPTTVLQYSSRTNILFLMKNCGGTEDDGDAKKSRAVATSRALGLTQVNINEDYFAQEFSSDLPSMAVSSAVPDAPPFASSQSPSPASKVNDDNDCDVANGILSGAKKSERAQPVEPMPPPGSRMVDSLERPPITLASNQDIAPGAFSVRSSFNTGNSRTVRSAIISHDTTRQLSEESNHDDGVPNSAGGYTGAHDSSCVATESGLYTVEAHRVPDGNEETIVVAEAVYGRMKWYQRRWISLGSILFACGLVVVVVVLVVRQPSAASGSSLTSPTTFLITAEPTTADPTAAPRTPVPITGAPIFVPISSPISGAPPTTTPTTKAPTTPDPTAAPPTPKPIAAQPTRSLITQKPTTSSKPTSLTPELIACNFLSIPNTTKCRSTVEFYEGATTGSTIPSEIGLLTQLTSLSFSSNSLTSTIPSEVGLLTQLTHLSFFNNSLSSTIPSEIGLMTQLTELSFNYNSLTSTIPIEIGLMTQLTSLSFWGNLLTSTISSEVGLLTQLESLSFDQNSLTSTIPSEIGLMTQLTALSFTGNLLTSTIPSEIGLLTQLTLLSFAHNSLTSTIPSEIRFLTQLRELYFSANALKGTIPSSLCSLPSLNSNIVIDCGEITCGSGCCVGRDGSDLFSCG
jgi:hypothetical protein